MSLFYKHAVLPDAPDVVVAVATGAEMLHEKLAALDAASLDISDYNREYFRRTQRKLRSNIERFAYILAWGIANADKALGQITLLEYGGGQGMLSLLARQCGVATVIYNDIYDVSCLDAETIANAAGLRADHYVCGDIDGTVEYVNQRQLACDVIVSSDVIEHVYSTKRLFAALPALSEAELSVAMSTHANPCNPALRRILMKKQRDVELNDREFASGHKKRDALRSYFNIRREIIADACNNALADGEVDALAAATRGWDAADIRAAIRAFINEGAMPLPLEHPTNTCDPLTGNWADRLVDPQDIEREFGAVGSKSSVLCGYYGTPGGGAKRLAARALDLVIRVFQRRAALAAPYLLLLGTCTGSLQGQPAVTRTAAGEPTPQTQT